MGFFNTKKETSLDAVLGNTLGQTISNQNISESAVNNIANSINNAYSRNAITTSTDLNYKGF